MWSLNLKHWSQAELGIRTIDGMIRLEHPADQTHKQDYITQYGNRDDLALEIRSDLGFSNKNKFCWLCQAMVIMIG